jgi:hypothetical protein
MCVRTNFSPSHHNLPKNSLHAAAILHNVSDKLGEADLIARVIYSPDNPFLLR